MKTIKLGATRWAERKATCDEYRPLEGGKKFVAITAGQRILVHERFGYAYPGHKGGPIGWHRYWNECIRLPATEPSEPTPPLRLPWWKRLWLRLTRSRYRAQLVVK